VQPEQQKEGDARATNSIVRRPLTTAAGRPRLAYIPSVPLHLIQHPVALDTLVALRDKTTPAIEFRRLARRISLLLAMEATRDLSTAAVRVETPLELADGQMLKSDVVVVPVLRAGLGMLEAVLELLPRARVGHIGLQRDERTAIASQYYSKLPQDLSQSVALIVDPMLATGGSAVSAIAMLQQAGAKDIRLVCIVAAPEGLAAVESAHPGVHVFTPVVDRELNARKFILPGLGDFGDRLYGTV
jgi:uracil phosphoribosyltransferase